MTDHLKMQASSLSSSACSVLGNRFGLLTILAGTISISAYSSWGWLVAIGAAPFLISLAPCVAMCALGMCTMGGKSINPTDLVSPGSSDITEKLTTESALANFATHTTSKTSRNSC